MIAPILLWLRARFARLHRDEYSPREMHQFFTMLQNEMLMELRARPELTANGWARLVEMDGFRLLLAWGVPKDKPDNVLPFRLRGDVFLQGARVEDGNLVLAFVNGAHVPVTLKPLELVLDHADSVFKVTVTPTECPAAEVCEQIFQVEGLKPGSLVEVIRVRNP